MKGVNNNMTKLEEALVDMQIDLHNAMQEPYRTQLDEYDREANKNDEIKVWFIVYNRETLVVFAKFQVECNIKNHIVQPLEVKMLKETISSEELEAIRLALKSVCHRQEAKQTKTPR